MSRSHRKFPICKQQADKFNKRYANKAVRHTEDIPNGGAYKKCFESYNICDWAYVWTIEEAINDWYMHSNHYLSKRFTTLEQYLAYWEKCTKRK